MAGKAPTKQGARRKQPRQFSAVAAVKRNAREQLGQPPPGKVIDERSVQAERQKHKPTLAELLLPDEES